MVLLQVTNEDLSQKLTITIITVGASVVIGLLTLIVSYINNTQQIKDRKRSELRSEIAKKLNDFYGPFQQYLNNSKELYKIFFNGKPKEFRTLTYLLNPQQIYTLDDGSTDKVILSENDKELLQQIMHVGQKMEDLIIEKGGLVDDPELRANFKTNPSITDTIVEGNGLLAIAMTHFQLIRLANLNKLKGDIEHFKNYVYPRELNQKIEAKIQELQNKLNELTR